VFASVTSEQSHSAERAPTHIPVSYFLARASLSFCFAFEHRSTSRTKRHEESLRDCVAALFSEEANVSRSKGRADLRETERAEAEHYSPNLRSFNGATRAPRPLNFSPRDETGLESAAEASCAEFPLRRGPRRRSAAN